MVRKFRADVSAYHT